MNEPTRRDDATTRRDDANRDREARETTADSRPFATTIATSPFTRRAIERSLVAKATTR